MGRSFHRTTWTCLLVFSALMHLSWAAPAAAMQKTDVIALNNGDKITGEIKGIDEGQVQLSTDAMGTVSIEWIYIASIQSDKVLEVDVQSGERHYGSVHPGDDPDNLRIVSTGGVVPVRRQEIVSVRPIGQSFWKKLDGNASLGFDFTRASDQVDYNLNVNSGYNTRGNRVTTSIASSIKKVAGATTSNRQQLEAGWVRDTRWDNWFTTVLGSLQHNAELDLDFRSTVGGGLGRYLRRTSRYRWIAYGAGLFVREQYSESAANRNFDALAGTGLDVYIFGEHDLSIGIDFAAIPSVTDAGRVRISANAQVNYELVHNFYVGAQFYEQFDSRPPQEGSLKNDLGLSTSFGYKW